MGTPAQELPPTEACRCGPLLRSACHVTAQPPIACRPCLAARPLCARRWPTDPPAEVATLVEAANQYIADALCRLETAVGLFERSDAQWRQQQQQHQQQQHWVAELLGTATKGLNATLLPPAWLERIKVRAPSLQALHSCIMAASSAAALYLCANESGLIWQAMLATSFSGVCACVPPPANSVQREGMRMWQSVDAEYRAALAAAAPAAARGGISQQSGLEEARQQVGLLGNKPAGLPLPSTRLWLCSPGG